MIRFYALSLSLAMLLSSVRAAPNIVIMLADDMGFGELACLNPERGKIPTPRLDALAAAGMVFTDAHSGSSVCTPTRYGLLAGRYAWRTRLQKGVLTGGESLIAKDRITLPELAKQRSYHTCIIGKWHLGMLFDGEQRGAKVPIGSTVTHGPIDFGGFDEFHGFHHSRQMQVWVDNDEVTESLEPVEMLPRLVAEAVDYIAARGKDNKPFLLYVPWNSPHSPVVPSPEWQGKSGLNAHADFVMQTDDSFGQVIDALREHNLFDNTLVICSADNGTSAPTSKKSQLEAMGHFPSGPLRGAKADLWDGGHRVPFIAHWPGRVAPATKCDKLVCLTDIYATLAELLDVEYPTSEGVDSFSFLPLLTGNGKHRRDHVIHHSFSGEFAVRKGEWKLLFSPGSGGWSKPNSKQAASEGLPMTQLYDMTADLGEKENRVLEQTAVAAELRTLIEVCIANGRSTPGNNRTMWKRLLLRKSNGRIRCFPSWLRNTDLSAQPLPDMLND